MTRRPPGRERVPRTGAPAGLQLVGPDGLPPTPPREDADPVDEPGSAGSGPPSTPPPSTPQPSPPLPSPPLPSPPLPTTPASPAGTGASRRAGGGPATLPTRTVDGPRIAVPARPGGLGPRAPRAVRVGADRTRSAPTGPRTSHPATHALAERTRQRAETFVPDDAVLAEVRVRAQERGVGALGPGAAAAMSFLAATTRARAAVEIGTGFGVGAVSVLRGMPADGLLTTIDVEVDHQRCARAAAVAAGFPANRLRMITGRALAVLPRLSDAGYDLVVVDGDAGMALEYPGYLAEALRLLRPGGVLVLVGVMAGLVSDPRVPGEATGAAAGSATARDAELVALRETAAAVREDDRWVPVMLPLADGLLCAARA